MPASAPAQYSPASRGSVRGSDAERQRRRLDCRWRHRAVEAGLRPPPPLPPWSDSEMPSAANRSSCTRGRYTGWLTLTIHVEPVHGRDPVCAARTHSRWVRHECHQPTLRGLDGRFGMWQPYRRHRYAGLGRAIWAYERRAASAHVELRRVPGGSEASPPPVGAPGVVPPPSQTVLERLYGACWNEVVVVLIGSRGVYRNA